jgi:hypothetical protein
MRPATAVMLENQRNTEPALVDTAIKARREKEAQKRTAT